MEEEGHISDALHKTKTSHGRKQLNQSIQKRMEFYFSDANLSKDRFMRNLLEENCGEVDISVFLKFNKIRELTDNVQDIVKALKKSSLLSVTEDKTKVFRTTPVKEKENVDECTIYVENLPMDADHDWLQSIFSQYGKIDYISVPKFKHSGKVKGFAFVEFETPEAAKIALDTFTKAGCKLPSTILPNQLCSIATFDRTEKSVVKSHRVFGSHSDTNKNNGSEEDTKKSDEPMNADETTKKSGIKKRSHESSSPSIPQKVPRLEVPEEETSKEEKPKKKRKNCQSVEESENDSKKSDCDESGRKISEGNTKNDSVESDNEKTSVNDTSADENCQGNSAAETNRKKRRKKKKKKSKKMKSDVASTGLQILSKCEWKKLRNKYLELQRSKMNSLKQYLTKIKHDDNQHIMRIEKTENESTEKFRQEPTSKEVSSTPRVQFAPGVILKLNFDEPIVDVKSFKNEVKSHEGVEYVDVNDGAFMAFVRCRDSGISKQLNSKKLGTSSTILSGEEEKNYWEKILKDRHEKMTNKSLRANQKGRTKLLKKAEKALGKRIRFDSS